MRQPTTTPPEGLVRHEFHDANFHMTATRRNDRERIQMSRGLIWTDEAWMAVEPDTVSRERALFYFFRTMNERLETHARIVRDQIRDIQDLVLLDDWRNGKERLGSSERTIRESVRMFIHSALTSRSSVERRIREAEQGMSMCTVATETFHRFAAMLERDATREKLEAKSEYFPPEGTMKALMILVEECAARTRDVLESYAGLHAAYTALSRLRDTQIAVLPGTSAEGRLEPAASDRGQAALDTP